MTVTRCLSYIGASLLALAIVATPLFIPTALGQAEGASLAVEITYDKRGPWGEVDAAKRTLDQLASLSPPADLLSRAKSAVASGPVAKKD